ncbi:hypothetical protein CRUP_003589 [Coryphaenoides rupestris]|nr:hypothetical protein CRUP_003589 [Coryphaenoides rupestris]
MGVSTPAWAKYSQLTAVPQIIRDSAWPMAMVFRRRLEKAPQDPLQRRTFSKDPLNIMNKGSLQFEDKWDLMRPIVLKLLRQESVTKQQWFDLFSDVHARVLSHQDDTALLKAYIAEWRKFFTQCDILPKPFCQLEITLMGKQGSNKKSNVEDSIVRKLMLDTWNESIFSNIKSRLQDSAMKLVHAERLGEAFDSQLVIGVRESYVNLCSNPDDKLQIYRDNFEKAYLDSTERFYRTQAPAYLQQNGVQNYMKYADAKLREEEKRALRYLETRRDCNSVQTLMECCVSVLVTSFRETILAECPGMIKRNETESEYGDSEKYVEQLLTLFNRFSRLVKEAFQDDPRFLTARDKTPLSKKLTSEEIEAKLKEVEVGMPADYVNKLARMFQDIKVSEDLNQSFKEMHKHNRLALPADSANIKILNAGAWSRTSEKVFVSLPTELEDLIPEVEDFYKKNHSGRKLHWHHLMSNGINLKLATELPDAELRRTLWSLVAFPKLKRQVLSYEPPVSSPKDFSEGTLFYVNQEFSLIKNSKVQKRGKINLIGRLQLTTERMREERERGASSSSTELVEILKNMFLPQKKKMIKEQMEWLIEHKYIKRDETDINTFIYMA